MTTKFIAPAHVSNVTLPNGRILSCEADGSLIAPDDMTDDDLRDIARNGFVPAPVVDEPVAEPVAPAAPVAEVPPPAKPSKKTPADANGDA